MCNNNCCMCCNCNTNTNNEETPQEVVYTAVCNSVSCLQNNQCRCCCKCCNCEKYKAHCEDDPENMVLALQEHMEDCCTQVGERLDTVECELEREICRSKAKDKEHDDKIDDLYYKESLDFNKSVFNPQTNKIEFWHEFYNEDHEPMPDKPAVHFTEWDIDASNFLKDWFIDDAELISNRYLELTFNNDPITDPDHNPIKITIDLYDFIDPGLYYTKTEIDLTVSTINSAITNLTNELNNYKTYVSNTYETKVAAGNHINNVDYDQNDHHTLIFTKENGQTITKTIPDSDLYIQSGEYTGGNLILTRNNNTTITIPVPATNHIVGGSITDRTITLTRENNGTPVTIQLPADNDHYITAANISGHTLTLSRNGGLSDLTVTLPDNDTNNYVTGGSVSGNTLTLTREGLSDITITLPTDNDHYVTGASVSGNTLTLTRNGGLSDITANLPADTNNYVNSATLDGNNILKLGRTGGLSDVTVDLSSLANSADNDHYSTSASLSGNVLTISGNSGFTPFSVDLSGISGTTNVTYGGNSVTIQQAITNIENRLNALEGLWEINPNDNTQVVAKSGRSAMAAGFYDSTVS